MSVLVRLALRHFDGRRVAAQLQPRRAYSPPKIPPAELDGPEQGAGVTVFCWERLEVLAAGADRRPVRGVTVGPEAVG